MSLIDQSQFPMLSPSIIAGDDLSLEGEIQSCLDLGISWVHCDVMDGHFVPNITFGPDRVKAIKKRFPNVVCDCHLMVSLPEVWVPRFINAGADLIAIHAESVSHDQINTLFKQCNDAGVRFGLALRPGTPIALVEPWISRIQLVVVMSVYPGFYGQVFVAGSEERVAQIRKMAGSHAVWIQVDGGIDPTTAQSVCEAGADILVAGGSFFKSPDRSKAYSAFESVFSKVCR